MNDIKKRNSAKWVIAVLLVFAMLAGVLGMFGGCGTDKEEKAPKTERTEAAGGMEIEMSEKSETPVKLTAKKVLSAEEGIAAQSESSFHLTATVDPPDAINKAITYTAEWENGGVGWASGKNVSDYIEVSQFSEGSPEADIRCKQAFGVPVIVTAGIQNDPFLRDSCKFNYVRKCVGSDYTVWTTWNEKEHARWTFVHTELNPTVDFIKLDSSYNAQEWAFGWANVNPNGGTNTNFHTSVNHAYDSVFTKNLGDYNNYTVSVAATQTYLDALYSVGFTPKVGAEEYQSVFSGFSQLVLDNFVTQKYFTDYAQYTALRTKLRDLTSQVMLRIKVTAVMGEGYAINETIYNVKFSASSVSPLVASVSLNLHEADF